MNIPSKIFFASDHAGFELKNALLDYVRSELGYDVEDLGPMTFDANDDYPDFVAPCAHAVAQLPNSFGIVCGGSGEGEAMVANRTSGIRAAVYYGGTPGIPKLSREHNNANILALGARFLDASEAKTAVAAFLTTDFSNEERHLRRIQKY